MPYWHSDLKSTLSVGGQNAKSMYIKCGTFLVKFDDRVDIHPRQSISLN